MFKHLKRSSFLVDDIRVKYHILSAAVARIASELHSMLNFFCFDMNQYRCLAQWLLQNTVVNLY